MGLARQLGEDERLVVHRRTHAKALIRPALGLIVTGALLGVGTALIPTAHRPVGQYAVIVVLVGLSLWWSVIPFLRWRGRTFTITNYRLITREGILSRTGTDLPLMRVNDVSYERSLLDRMFGCGTITLSTAAEGSLVLDDVPEVERVQLLLSGLLFRAETQQVADPVEDDALARTPRWGGPRGRRR